MTVLSYETEQCLSFQRSFSATFCIFWKQQASQQEKKKKKNWKEPDPESAKIISVAAERGKGFRWDTRDS
jgi:hypothetical protein